MSAEVMAREEDVKRLEKAKKKYKKRNLMLELMGGQYYNFEGFFLQKDDGMFLNWLCHSAFEEIKRLNDRDPADCTGCIYQEGMGGPCDSCCRRYRDYYEEC